ncbi:MAG: hypothetical protein JXR65_07590 [Bacteroidales bacterium]|nr:hypothetical protein [Bacteroidales bacterium]
MKKLIITTLFILSFTLTSQVLTAQSAPIPPSEHGTTSNQSGGGAPIGSGLIILLGMAGAYGGMKGYKQFKKEKEV